MTGSYAGKLAVVTGAGGFIGSHVVEALVREGARVRALCRYTSTSSRGHLAGLAPEVAKSVEVVLGNVEDPAAMRALVKGADVVFHLAALIGIPYSYVARSKGPVAIASAVATTAASTTRIAPWRFKRRVVSGSGSR